MYVVSRSRETPIFLNARKASAKKNVDWILNFKINVRNDWWLDGANIPMWRQTAYMASVFFIVSKKKINSPHLVRKFLQIFLPLACLVYLPGLWYRKHIWKMAEYLMDAKRSQNVCMFNTYRNNVLHTFQDWWCTGKNGRMQTYLPSKLNPLFG